MVNIKIVECCLNCDNGVFYPDYSMTEFKCLKKVEGAWMDMRCSLWIPDDEYKAYVKLNGE